MWREQSARLVGALTRVTRDVALAEDLAQDAMLAALNQWPKEGVPDNPAAWLAAVAKRRAVDHFRRSDNLRHKTAELGQALEEFSVPDLAAGVDHIEDDVLRLIFLCCHPELAPDSRAALTLRLIGGLSVAEIARAFLAKEAAVGQRISRAKRTLQEAGAEFDLPTGSERRRRLDDVMAVIYLIFNEGYSATAGEHWMRPDLCQEAIRLARLLASLVGDEPEVHGLHALLELQASRTQARTDAEGNAVLLEDQDRTRWDQVMVRRGLAALDRAMKLDRPVGAFVLQASIAAGHARASTAADTDWVRIAQLYDVLADLTPSPVVEVNRAVAHGRAHGPDAGLAVLAAVEGAQVLANSHLVPSVRGDLLARSGRYAEAAAAFDQAAARTANEAERAVLRRRASENRVRDVENRRS